MGSLNRNHHSTEYIWFVNVTDGAHWKHEVFSFQTELKMVFNPFDEGWQYRKNITIDHTKVSGDLTGFPILVSTIDSDLRDKAQYDGDDILFMDGPGFANRLYHEIEKYVGSSGELVAWVNVPILSSNLDTVLYVYYGNPSCSDQQFPEKVWDSDYVMVHHMKDQYGNKIYDSTIYDNDGTISGASWTTGISGAALDFTGTSTSYVNCGSDSSLNIIDAISISVWVKPYLLHNIQDIIFRSTSQPFRGYTLEARQTYIGILIQGMTRASASFTLPQNSWTHICISRPSGGTYTIYINGVNKTTNTNSISPASVTTPFFIGGSAGTGGWEGRDFEGVIDEVRILKTARNAEWISTSYNNQNNPTGFLSFGPEETGP